MKTSTILFIIANLVVMSVPYWSTRPLNALITSGKVRSEKKEHEARYEKRSLKDSTNTVGPIGVRVHSDSGNIELVIELASQDELIMDTVYKNFMTVDIKDSKIDLFFSKSKYEAWKNHSSRKDMESQDTYTNYTEAISDGDGTYAEVSVKLRLRHLGLIDAHRAIVHIEASDTFPIQDKIDLQLDTASVFVNYAESAYDSSQSSTYNRPRPLKVPVEATLKHGSQLKFSFLYDIDLNLRLKNNIFTIARGVFPYRKLTITYDKNSDVNLHISDLGRLNLRKTN